MTKVRMGYDPKLKPLHFHDPAWQAFEMRGEGNFGARPRATKKGGDKEEVPFPPSSRALRASLASEIPFPFPLNACHAGYIFILGRILIHFHD